MELVLDQPNLLAPACSRRLRYGEGDRAERVFLLNGRGRTYEGISGSSDLSLKWMLSGSADYDASGRHFRLVGDTQLLLNPGEPYRLQFRELSESLTVFYSRALADSAWSALEGDDARLPEFPTVSARSPQQLRLHFERLSREAALECPDGEVLIERSMTLLTDIIGLARQRRRQAKRVPALRATTRNELLRRLARAEDYLLGVRKPSLRGAAAASALSEFHLLRVFRTVHGVTPLAFASRARLTRARDNLLLTNDSIEAVSRLAGYESRAAFDRAFRREFGISPGAIRLAR